jgi:hypothetical protein
MSRERTRRSTKTWWLLLPIVVFCLAAFFGLVHHFYRYAWAGTLFYYGIMLLVAVIFVECLLIAFQ